MKYSLITISDSIFSDNKASVGAGIYYDCSITNQCSLMLSNNTFRDNIAAVKGGGVYYNLHRPEFNSNQFANNSAPYGPNIASYSLKIVKAGTANNKVTLDNIASGIEYNNTLEFELVDNDGQVMILENENTVKITSATQGASITGSDVVKIKNGIASFTGLTFVAKAGMKDVEYVLTSKAVDNTVPYAILSSYSEEFKNSLTVSFRYCKPGEIETQNKQ